MSPQRIVGIVLLIVGVVVLILGINASHSVADQVSNTFTGRLTRGVQGLVGPHKECGNSS